MADEAPLDSPDLPRMPLVLWGVVLLSGVQGSCEREGAWSGNRDVFVARPSMLAHATGVTCILFIVTLAFVGLGVRRLVPVVAHTYQNGIQVASRLPFHPCPLFGGRLEDSNSPTREPR
ncbi:hypothetical protein HKD37_U058251 [Glycine soja]